MLLATGCVWRAATPDAEAISARDAGRAEIEQAQHAVDLDDMRAVELFALVVADRQAGADFAFTCAFYQSVAFSYYLKKHFIDLMLTRSMKDAHAVESLNLAQRSPVLWDSLFIGE